MMYEDKNIIINNDNKKIIIFCICYLFEFLKIWKYNKKYNWLIENYKIGVNIIIFNILFLMVIKSYWYEI